MSNIAPASPAQGLTRLAAIKQFFESDGGKKVEMGELVQLKKNHPDDVEQLAQLSAAAIGKQLVALTT